jgi:hypothetical protein
MNFNTKKTQFHKRDHTGLLAHPGLIVILGHDFLFFYIYACSLWDQKLRGLGIHADIKEEKCLPWKMGLIYAKF